MAFNKDEWLKLDATQQAQAASVDYQSWLKGLAGRTAQEAFNDPTFLSQARAGMWGTSAQILANDPLATRGIQTNTVVTPPRGSLWEEYWPALIFLGVAGGVAATSAGIGGAGTGIVAGIGGLGAVADASNAAATTSIVASIFELVREVRDFIRPIVETVRDAVGTVRDVVVAINDGIIKPIVEPIIQTMKIVKGLTETIERLQKQGIEGILRIPQAITDAFTSLDATFQRAVAMLAAGNVEAIGRVLVPGLVTGIGGPLGEMGAIMRATWPTPSGPWSPPREFDITGPLDQAAFQQEFEAFVARIQAEPGVIGSVVKWVWDLSRWIPFALAHLEGLWVRTLEFQRATAGLKRFSEDTTLSLFGANVITHEDAVTELRAMGYSETRAAALLESVRRIPQDTQALDWFYRGMIDEAGLRAILDVNNWNEEDAKRVIESSRKLLSVSDTLRAWQRGIVSEADARRTLTSQGWSDEWVDVLYAASLAPQDLGGAIRRVGRSPLVSDLSRGGENLLVAPDAIMEVGRAAGQSDNATSAAWSLHWQLLTPAEAVEGYFRGWFTEAQIEQFLDAHSFPRSLQRNYIDLRRPRIPYRTVTTLMSQGIITELEARDILRSHGFEQADINWLVSIERRGTAATSSKDADAFAGLTQATVLRLYDAGTLTREDARELLTAIGMGENAADSVLLLNDVQDAAQTRTSEIDLIVARTTSGAITYDEAVGELSALGASAQEQNKALAKIRRGLKAGTKLPSEDKILALWRRGLLTREAAADALAVLGYNAGWSELLLQLEATRGS